MKYNILYVIDNLEFGGGERGFAQLACRLNRDLYSVHVACNPGGIFWEKLSGINVNRFALNMENKFNAGNIFKLAQIINKRRIHVVHSQGLRTDFLARIASRLLRNSPKIISTVQMPVEGFDVNPLRKTIYKYLDTVSERYVDKFITVSQTLKNSLIIDHKIPKHKISKIYNGIELKEYKPTDIGEWRKEIREEFRVPENVFLIGAIGRMVWQKGFEFLIRSLPKIEKTKHETKTIIVGEGPERERVQNLAQRLMIEKNVYFAGFRNDVKKILSAIDVLVIPSLLEGFPMITLEAMAMAKPIIATDIDGINEQITNRENGVLIPAKNIDALAAEIINLIDDRKTAKVFGEKSRKKVEQKFSVEKMVKKTEATYNSLF